LIKQKSKSPSAASRGKPAQRKKASINLKKETYQSAANYRGKPSLTQKHKTKKGPYFHMSHS